MIYPSLAASQFHRAKSGRQHPLSARGFSLLELMIAIFITVFIVAGMLGIIVSMRGSFTTQDQLQRVQENERFALTVLDNTIRNAGYFSDPRNVTSDTAFPLQSAQNPDGTQFAASQSVSGTTGSGAVNDTVNVRFQTLGGDGITNCLGATSAAGAMDTWTNSFSINSQNQLVCSVISSGTTRQTEALVDNVASMKILYGVDTNSDGSADKYVDASAIGASPAWTDVNSVQLVIKFQDLVNPKTGSVVTPIAITHNISLMNKP